jgi:hypothetical protein
MKRAQSRKDFKDKILLSLGHPLIRVDVSNDQLDLAIDKSLKNFFKYSAYGAFESHYAYQVTVDDVTAGYIPIPSNIDAVVEVIHKGFSFSDLSFATAEYQMTRETFMAAQRFNNVSLVDYVTMKQRLYNTQLIIEQPRGFEFVRFQRRLIPYFTYFADQFIVMKCYENVDAEIDGSLDPKIVVPANDMWDDEQLLELAVAETKMIWGNILKKFGSVVLPGGVSLDGNNMYQEAKADVKKIIQSFQDSNPIDFAMG